MRDGIKIFDADMHVMEYLKFVDFMEPGWRNRGPKDVTTSTGSFPIFGGSELEGVVLSGPTAIYPTDKLEEGARTVAQSYLRGMEKYAEAQADSFGPKSQMEAIEKEGIDLAVMYPSSAILGFPSPRTNGLDPKLSAAVCRGYNNWLTDFCSKDPNKMKGVAAIPIHDVEEAVKEARRVKTELGMVGAFIRPNVINGRNWHDSYYDPFYKELVELDMPLVVHEGTAGGPPGADERFRGSWVMMHIAAHPLEQMLACESMVVGGVMERHPKLRVAFLECGSSWLLYWLWRMDEDLEAWGYYEVPWLKMKPSEYFLRQGYTTMEGDEPAAPHVIQMFGDNNLMWASDYPHPDAAFPNASKEFLELEGIAKESKAKVLWDNPVRFYGIT